MNKVFIRLFVVFSIGAFTKCQSQDYWLTTNSPTTRSLRSAQFLDSLTGWAAGDSGVIIHTTNAGQSWTHQDSNIESDIVDVFFLNENLGWALAWNSFNPPFGTIILRTSDGGSVWNSEQYPEENIFMYAIRFLDSLDGWMGGSGGTIVSTTNGGTDWTPSETSGLCSGFDVLDLAFYSSEYAVASGGFVDISGVVWRTTNSGEEWFSQCISPEPIQQLYFFDSLNIIGVGGDFEFGSGIVRSTNGGINWNYRSLEVFGIALALSFRTTSEAWVPLGFAEKFIYTLDSGNTWDEIATPAGAAILYLAFTDSLHGYAVGYDGVILKYNPSPVSVQGLPSTNIPSGNRLFQNYPNPFNPITAIAFSISSSAHVTMRIYDVLGKEVAILLDEKKDAGIHRVNFTGKDLPSGVYYYKLRGLPTADPDKEFSLTRKMLLVK